MTMSLTTPSNIRELQIKLYRKAKNEPEYRFYILYDKIYREDTLSHAYKLARANKGAPGVDGQSFEDIESTGLERWLTGIREELRNKTYRPQPVRRVKIPKRDNDRKLAFRLVTWSPRLRHRPLTPSPSPTDFILRTTGVFWIRNSIT